MLTKQEAAFIRVLNLLEDAGCIRHVMLIGSWAEFVYREAGVIVGFNPNITTRDVDFLVRNLRRPSPAAQLIPLARERGFYIESDRLNGTTKLLDTTGLEVEFLIGKMGAGVEPALKTNVGVTAQALRHMEILSRNPMETQCLGHTLNVPTPEAYALHKMVINKERGIKAEKDARAVCNLMPLLSQEGLRVAFAALSRKEKLCVREFAERYSLLDALEFTGA